jgi:hypothetical protein
MISVSQLQSVGYVPDFQQRKSVRRRSLVAPYENRDGNLRGISMQVKNEAEDQEKNPPKSRKIFPQSYGKMMGVHYGGYIDRGQDESANLKVNYATIQDLDAQARESDPAVQAHNQPKPPVVNYHMIHLQEQEAKQRAEQEALLHREREAFLRENERLQRLEEAQRYAGVD